MFNCLCLIIKRLSNVLQLLLCLLINYCNIILAHFRLTVSVTRYNRMASADTVLAMKGMAADPLKRKLLLKVHFYIIKCVLHLSNVGTTQL